MIPLTPFQPPMLIFKGNPKCRRTVVITIFDLPTQTPNVWISSDKNSLLNGHDQVSYHTGRPPGFSAGVQLVDFDGSTFRMVLPDVSSDIYAFATNYDPGFPAPKVPVHADPLGVICICIEAF